MSLNSALQRVSTTSHDITWGEFKKLVEDAGVTEDSCVDYMDFSSGAIDDEGHLYNMQGVEVYENGRFNVT